MTKVTNQSRISLLRFKPYFLLFTASTISYFGTGIQFIANSWIAVQLTGSNLPVAIMLAATAFPGIILLPFIGGWVDRWDRKLICIIADVTRGVAVITIPILFWLDALSVWHLYLVAFLVAVGDQIYNASIIPFTKDLIPPEKLLIANSTSSLGNQSGLIAGTGIAGLIIATFNPYIAMVINSLSFAISALFFIAIKYSDKNTTVQGIKRSFKEDISTAFNYIRNNVEIIKYYLVMLLFISSLRTINVLLPGFCKNVLKVGATGFGFIEVAFALGAVAGNLLIPFVVNTFGKERSMFGGTLLLGFSLVLFSLSNSLYIALSIYFLIGIYFQTRILYLTKVQTTIDSNVLGRVHALFNTCFYIISLCIYLGVGLLADLVDMRVLYIAQGVIVISVLVSTTIFSTSFSTSRKLT